MTTPKKNQISIAGGKARFQKFKSKKQLIEFQRKASAARWGKKEEKGNVRKDKKAVAGTKRKALKKLPPVGTPEESDPDEFVPGSSREYR
jgi:hypothetical protein